MLQRLEIENLKGFQKFAIDFGRLNLLVGGNNSGKTTVFHALQLAFWCLKQTATEEGKSVVLGKTQVPELGAVPYFHTKDLFHNQQMRVGKAPQRIRLTLKTTVAPDVAFEIYPAFSRNLLVDGRGLELTSKQYQALLLLTPVFIPGTIGITVREDFYRKIAQERLIIEGRQNQVLRNLVYRLKAEGEWGDFVKTVSPLFKLSGIDVPFDDTVDQWLTATYREGECEFDFVSAGSGFLQVINLLSFLFLHESRVALLDEPDSHMHDDLQRLTFDLLDDLSQKRNIQLIVATHSPTFVDAAGLENVLLIDRKAPEPLRAKDSDALVPLLADRGLSLPPSKIMNTLKSRRVLFVEGEEKDYDDFIQRFGEKLRPGFRTATRGLTVFETRGSSSQWPFDAVDYFEKLLGVPLAYVHVSDRDFLSPKQIMEREARAAKEKKQLIHLSRRNRECYLIDPVVLHRLLGRKWEAKHPGVELPKGLTLDGLTEQLLSYARSAQEDTLAHLLVQQEPNLRGDVKHRASETAYITKFFEDAYRGPLAGGHLPYALLDGKTALKQLRSAIAQQFSISFSDREIIEAFEPAEVPEDVRRVVDATLALFGGAGPAATFGNAGTPESPAPTQAPAQVQKTLDLI